MGHVRPEERAQKVSKYAMLYGQSKVNYGVWSTVCLWRSVVCCCLLPVSCLLSLVYNTYIAVYITYSAK